MPYASNYDCPLQEIVESAAAAVAVRTLTCADVESRHTERFVFRVVDNRLGKFKFLTDDDRVRNSMYKHIQRYDIWKPSSTEHSLSLFRHDDACIIELASQSGFAFWPSSFRILHSDGPSDITGATTIR